jgi:hypothetical protein
MSESTPTSRKGFVTRFVVVFVLLGAAITTTIAVGHRSTPSTVAASPFTTVKVSTGTLTTSEQVDGSVVLSDVTEVLHRIAGQSASSRSSSSNSGSGPASTVPPANAAATSTAAASLAAASVEVLAPVSSDPCVTPTTEPAPTTVPDTTVLDTTTTALPDTTLPDRTTTAPDTTLVATTPTTPPCDTTSTTASSTPAGGGSRPGGGSIGGKGSSGASGGAAAGGATSGRVTEVITSIIAEGTPASLGTVLYAVESRPVVAMSGALPAWRTLQVGSADGTDILQLELSLVALGYDRDHTMTVDGHFDSDTKAAVKRWQTGYGLDVTGIVTLGSVVFLPWTATASSISKSVGDAVGDGDQVLTLAAASQTVVIDVPAGDESFVVPGLTVRIGTVDGTVELIRSVTRSGSTGVQAVIAPTTPLEGAGNGAAVKVTITHDGLAGVLLVPADALVSRLDGTYAIEVAQPDGTGVWTPVDVLGIAGGKVAVKGNGIVDGTEVLRPV